MKDAIRILQLLSALSPVAMKLLEELAADMKDKSDEEILAGADAKWAAIKAKAQAELAKG